MIEYQRELEKRLKTLDRALLKADEKRQKRRVQAIRREMAALRAGIRSMRIVDVLTRPDGWEG